MTHLTKTVRPAALLALICFMSLGLFLRGGDNSTAYGDVPCYDLPISQVYCCADLGVTGVTLCVECEKGTDTWPCCNLVPDDDGGGKNDTFRKRIEVTSGGNSPAVYTLVSPQPQCWYYKLKSEPCGKTLNSCNTEPDLTKVKCVGWQQNSTDLCP